MEVLRRGENAKSLLYYAGWAHESGARRAGIAASAARSAATDALDYAARENIAVHGGIGATWEHDAPLFFRRAQLSRRLLGGDGPGDGPRGGRAAEGRGRLSAPTLTILMPVFNEEERLPTAIEQALSVEYPFTVELLLVDDGSSDRTPEIIARRRRLRCGSACARCASTPTAARAPR